MKTTQLFIDGQWRDPESRAYLDVVNPATEEVQARLADGGPADVDLAVQAAARAFPGWSSSPGSARASLLRAMASEVEKSKSELSVLETQDSGKPLPEAEWDMDDVCGCFRYYADLAERLGDGQAEEAVALPDGSYRGAIQQQPVGVVAAVVPWNYPLLMALWKVAPALAAGCTVVLKPSELTPLTALELGKLAQRAGLPSGVLNIVTGAGASAGAALVAHPRVDKVAFTGSVPTGARVMAACAPHIKNVSLELGGKSPALVFRSALLKQQEGGGGPAAGGAGARAGGRTTTPEVATIAGGSTGAPSPSTELCPAALDRAVEWVMFGCFWTNGQICSATSRLLLEESVAEPFLRRLVERTRQIAVGDPLRGDTKLGPLVSKTQYLRVLSYIDGAVREGATVLCGGSRPPSAAAKKGFFIQPTVLSSVSPSMRVWREEVFGPVLAVMTFRSEQEALQLANDSEYGLAAAVFSKDRAQLQRVTAALRCGIVWQNCSQPCFVQLPWGGLRKSGVGRELGEIGLKSYLEPKQVCEYVAHEDLGWYPVSAKL